MKDRLMGRSDNLELRKEGDAVAKMIKKREVAGEQYRNDDMDDIS